jgi:glycosyltransferase involved in cell wall biosynthesis
VLLVLVLARLLCPRRWVTAHWHCFLEPGRGVNGRLFALYQWLALRLVPWLSAVVTTSPLLAQELEHCGCAPQRLFVLPCCLSQQQEQLGLTLPLPESRDGEPLRVLFIGRLDSYKRLDWLLQALATLTSPWQLVVVGDGPKRLRFEQLAHRLFPQVMPVRFLGRLPESAKLAQLAAADVLVLPSDCSNEAFGIVQLEAMAAGRLALAFDQPRSGMGWVGRLEGLPWSQSPDGLAEVLQRLADQPALRHQLSLQARERYRTLFARDVWLQQLQRLGDSVGNR